MTRCTLVTGGSSAQREAAIAAMIDPQAPTGIIFEGIHPASAPLLASDMPNLKISTIAASCPCCGNGLVLRVTLDRLLQRHPAYLYISLASDAHLSHLRQFLTEPPYAALLSLAPVVFCGS